MFLVTGATGTVGGELLRLLCGSGVPTRALVRSPEKADTLRGYDCETAIGSFEDPRSLDAALAGVEAMFLCCAPSADQVRLEQAAVDAAARCGVRVVKLGVIGWDTGGLGRVGRTHAEIIERLRAAGVPHTVLAANDFQQNLFRQAGLIQSAGVLAMPRGDAAVSCIDARDVAAVAAHVLTSGGHDGASYTLTGPEALTGEQHAEALTAVVRRPIRYAPVEPDQARDGMIEAGIDPWLVDGLLELAAAMRSGAAAVVTGEVSAATGRPARALPEFLADYRSAFA